MSSNKKRYIAIIAEHVSGKSKGPSGFSRVKPVKYRQAKFAHPIVYYRKYLATEEEAMYIAKDVSREMFKLYSMNLGSSYTRVMDYSVILHNLTDNESETIYSTMPDIREVNGLMYDHKYEGRHFKARASNETFASWKIISWHSLHKRYQ